MTPWVHNCPSWCALDWCFPGHWYGMPMWWQYGKSMFGYSTVAELWLWCCTTSLLDVLWIDTPHGHWYRMPTWKHDGNWTFAKLKVFKSCRVTTQLFHNFCTWCYKDWCSLQSRRLNANVVAIWQLKVCLSLILTCCRVVINSVVPHQIPASCALDWCFLWSLTWNTTMVTMATMFV